MTLTKLIHKIRALIMRVVRPSNLQPVSSKFGFDRGTPIDRYWIEKFLSSHFSDIRGRCLEITDNTYTLRFGQNRVYASDVLDINTRNEKANIHGDIRHLFRIKKNTYDCIILTHILGLIDDVHSAASECYRILKPGGVLLLTSSCLGPILKEKVHWRFTPHSINHIFSKYFKTDNMEIKTYGNVFTAQCFLAGMAQEELTMDQLEYNDPRFPCIVTLRALK